MKTNIYLDIDGVLLAGPGQAAFFADEFLQYVLKKFPDNTYWLTTHCWKGENRAVAVLEPALKKRTLEMIKKVKPTKWDEWKTDGINFSRPFLWFDDDLFPEEQRILEHYKALDSWVGINLYEDPYQLQDALVRLKHILR